MVESYLYLPLEKKWVEYRWSWKTEFVIFH